MVTPARLAETLGGNERQVAVVQPPSGTSSTGPQLRPPGHQPGYPRSGPRQQHHLLLSFSTPLAPLADALVGMFNSIAGTLRSIP